MDFTAQYCVLFVIKNNIINNLYYYIYVIPRLLLLLITIITIIMIAIINDYSLFSFFLLSLFDLKLTVNMVLIFSYYIQKRGLRRLVSALILYE